MNYNDIDARLKRIYFSIEKQNKYGGEVLGSTKVTIEKDESTGTGRIIFSFGDGDDPEVLNQIHSVIGNLANLKDHLIERMKAQGKDPQLIEDDINTSLPIQLVLDLHNQEKHGYPLTKTRRSGRDPLLSNIYAGIGPSNKPDNITYTGSNGELARNVMVSIHADITDGQGNRLYSLDQLANQAIKDWEAIIQKNQLV